MDTLQAIRYRLSTFSFAKTLRKPGFYPFICFYLFLFVVFLLNGFHEKYPDEFDNILGGWYILHGRLPYVGFFTHHGPVAYFIAALIELFSGHSFVRFRIVYSIALFIFSVSSYQFLKNRIGYVRTSFFLPVIGFIALSATYFWTHMLLADNISAFCLLLVFGLVFLKAYYRERLTLADFYSISLLCFLSVLSSLTYVYLLIGIYIFAVYYFFRNPRNKFFSLITLRLGIILCMPYILFLVYLLLTGSLHDYFYQSIIFNQKYYIYNYPRAPGAPINPLRFAIVIAHNFFASFSELLVQVRDLNFSYPINITLAVGNAALFIYLLVKRKYDLLLFLVFVLVYANSRSNPLTSAIRDYQSAVYIFISIFNIFFVLPRMYEEISEGLYVGRKVLFSLLLSVLGVYGFFSVLFIVNSFDNTFYPKYMGTAPLIYDRPEIAPILNKIIAPTDYVWMGPFEFEELWYLHGKLASKYHILNPGMGSSDQISQGMIADIAETKPKIIYFDKYFFILGRNPVEYAQPFIHYLSDHYITLYEYREGNKRYVSVIPVTSRIDLETKLYILKERKDEVIKELLQNNLIKEEAAK